MAVVSGSSLVRTAVLQLPSLLLSSARGGGGVGGGRLKNSPKPPGSEPWYGGLPGNWNGDNGGVCVCVQCVLRVKTLESIFTLMSDLASTLLR